MREEKLYKKGRRGVWSLRLDVSVGFKLWDGDQMTDDLDMAISTVLFKPV